MRLCARHLLSVLQASAMAWSCTLSQVVHSHDAEQAAVLMDFWLVTDTRRTDLQREEEYHYPRAALRWQLSNAAMAGLCTATVKSA